MLALCLAACDRDSETSSRVGEPPAASRPGGTRGWRADDDGDDAPLPGPDRLRAAPGERVRYRRWPAHVRRVPAEVHPEVTAIAGLDRLAAEGSQECGKELVIVVLVRIQPPHHRIIAERRHDVANVFAWSSGVASGRRVTTMSSTHVCDERTVSTMRPGWPHATSPVLRPPVRNIRPVRQDLTGGDRGGGSEDVCKREKQRHPDLEVRQRPVRRLVLFLATQRLPFAVPRRRGRKPLL